MAKQNISIPEYLKIAKDLDVNIALLGAHGRSKTSQVRQYAENIGYELETVILSQLLPDDLVGLPVLSEDKKTTVTAFPKWLEKACDKKKKIILFFDEFSNAEKDVQAAILNLLETREVSDKQLSPNTQIILAFNPKSIAPNAKTLSKATRDRICIVPVKDDRKMFLDYYREQGMNELADSLELLSSSIKNYDIECDECLNENAELTWRSAEKISKIVKYCLENKCDESVIFTLAVGYAGDSVRPFLVELLDRFKQVEDPMDAFVEEVTNLFLNDGSEPTIKKLCDSKEFGRYEYSQLLVFFKKVNEKLNKSKQKVFYKEIIEKIMEKEFLTAYGKDVL